LVELESDKATIDAYSKILKNLAQPRSIKHEAGDNKKFVDDSKTEFNKLVCADITKQITNLTTGAPNEAPDAKKSVRASWPQPNSSKRTRNASS
jgi:hypothetical protein